MSNFFISEFQKEIWHDHYRYNNESVEATFMRIAYTIFAGNTKNKANSLYMAMYNKRISFGGRVIANTGTDYKNTFSFNCYGAQRSTKPYDSIENIYNDLKNAAQILKTEGGIGFNFNHLRPQGTLIKGIRVGTPGVVAFMELYDKSAEIITRGNTGEILQKNDEITKNKIRKGAEISMLDVRHPEIVRYVEAKKRPNFLTKFNMSVAITDSFMKAVVNDEDFDLWFPDIHFEKYDEEWAGDFDDWEEKGYPKVVYETMKAKKLWNIIIKNCYNRNEPGLFFIDNANKYNNLKYYQKVTGTNPCGEICMLADSGVFEYNGIIYNHIGDICNLGHINLVSYWDGKTFHWDMLQHDIGLLVESLDNLIDISGYPLEELKNSAFLRRKIGCGLMGYGSLLMMMGMRYGSEEANEFTKSLMGFYANHAYRASAKLAKVKGSFPLYDEEKFLNNGYVKTSGILWPNTISMIKEFGIRNSQLLTMAPTGTTGILVGIVSGGCEPEFDLEYFRWVVVNHKIQEVLEGLKYPDVLNGEWKETEDFKLSIDGDEEVLLSKCGEFKFDKSRGLTKKVKVMSYGWKWVLENLSEEEIKENEGVYATAMELSVEEHLEPFKILSKYVDNSISKTVNLRKDYPFDEFSNLFIDLWKSGVRGVTTYREGTMTSVLDSSKKEDSKVENTQEDFFEVWKEQGDDVVKEDIQIPDEYIMHGYKIKSEGKKWYVHLCFKDEEKRKPFAIFCQTNHREAEINTYDTLDQLEILARKSRIPKKFRDENKKKYSGQTNVNKITRTIGLLLRHNVNVGAIVSTLDKVDVPVSSFIYRIKKFLLKFTEDITLSEKCPECKDNLMMVEGCCKCKCGYSKC